MKRFYWIIGINIIAIFALTVLGSYLDALFLEKERLISLLLILGYTGVFFGLTSRKTPITLSEEDLQVSVPEREEFSDSQSKPRWILIALGVPAFFALIFAYMISYFVMYDFFRGTPFIEAFTKFCQLLSILLKTITFGVFMVVWIIVAIISYKRKLQNTFILDGNTLIIHEYPLFRKAEEIRIPLDLIEGVCMRYNGTYYYGLDLNVQGVTRRMLTGKRTLEIGKAILQHKRAFA